MSAEIVAIVVSSIGVVVTLGGSFFACFAWVVRRIDAVDTKLSDRIDAIDLKLGTRIDVLSSDVMEIKITLARIEGPVRQLIVPHH